MPLTTILAFTRHQRKNNTAFIAYMQYTQYIQYVHACGQDYAISTLVQQQYDIYALAYHSIQCAQHHHIVVVVMVPNVSV